MDLKLTILIATIVVNALLGVVVYKNNPKNATNRVFAGLSAVTIFWLIDLYLSVTPAYVAHSLLWVRLSVFFAALQIAFFYLLARTLPSATLQVKKKALLYLVVATSSVMAIALSPFAFTGVIVGTDSQVEAIPGPGLPLFVLLAISLSFGAVFTLLKKLRSASGRTKEQYKYVVLGLTLMLGLLITTVLIPVALFKNSDFVSFAPLYTIIFLGFTTIAIVRHRLFDIRTVIARSVAYLLVVATFAVAYTIAVFGVSYFAFGDERIVTSQHIAYIALALVFTPTIYWLKRLFDKITNRIFFRDAYNSQSFLNQLNKVLVSTIETEELLSRSARLIGETLKTEFCMFGVRAADGKSTRIISDTTPRLDVDDIIFLRKSAPHGLSGVSVTEELSGDRAHLGNLLQKKNVGIFAPLTDASRKNGEVYGYLILGVKKSGNAYSQQDIKTLEIVANELTIAIQNVLRFEEIENFNVTLKQKVDDATKELRRTNDRLRVLDQTKDDFISMASHQLRTPLTSVKGYVSMVLDGDGGKINETQRKLLTQSFLSSQRMVYLISDLLNVSRLKTGKFLIEPVESNLAEVIDEEVEQLVETVNSRGLELNYHKPEHFPTLMLDETKIRQVLMNFIDNAIYYTPSGGHIDVYLVDKPESIEFTVVDDGIGVPKYEQHHLFSKFYRASNAKSVRPDGTGLGIFMAKKVIIAQGGAVIFRSAEGKGSTFGFTFPKAKLSAIAGIKPGAKA